MSNLDERNDRDGTASSSNERNAFKKQKEELNRPIIEMFRSNGGKVGG